MFGIFNNSLRNVVDCKYELTFKSLQFCAKTCDGKKLTYFNNNFNHRVQNAEPIQSKANLAK